MEVFYFAMMRGGYIQNGACYIRVSTDDQTEYSPDAQLKALKHYAQQNNIILTNEHIYIDEGISGRNADKRPAFQLMIATAKSKPKPFDVILVHKFDRFARSREDSVVYKSLLKREADIKVISTTESIENDKFSVILEAMLEAMAEYYSLNLSEEVKKGMTEKAHRGEYQSTPPFGYTMEKHSKQLLIHPKEAEIIRFIFEKFASKEMGMRAIAIYINNLGIRTKRGNLFENRNIEYILNNPVYMGKTRWTPTERIRRNYNHPDSIIVDGTHEPIISQELWDKAQEVMREIKEHYPKGVRSDSKRVTWLHGLVHCGTCDKKLVRSADKYMQCNAYSRGQCTTSNSIRYSVLEDLTLEALKRDYTSPLDLAIAPKKVVGENDLEYEFINNQLEAFGSKLKRIKIAYQDGIDTLDEYQANKTYLDTEREKLLARLAGIKETVLQADDEQPIKKRLQDVHELLTDDTINLEIKYQAAHFLISKITYEKQAKTLKLTYKY